MIKCGFYSRAASIRVRLLFECGFYSSVASIRVRLLFECGFYSSAASIRVRLLFECGFYSSAAFIRVRLLFECGFYSSAASIRVRLLIKCGFWSSAASMHDFTVLRKTYITTHITADSSTDYFDLQDLISAVLVLWHAGHKNVCPTWMPYTCGTSVKAPCHARVLKSPWWWALHKGWQHGIHRAKCSTSVQAHKELTEGRNKEEMWMGWSFLEISDASWGINTQVVRLVFLETKACRCWRALSVTL